jgi:hypothetical protein
MYGFSRLVLSTGLLLTGALMLAACDNDATEPQAAADATDTTRLADEVARETVSTEETAPAIGTPVPRITTGDQREIEWDDLIPDDYQPEKLLADLNLDDLADDDPRAREAMEKLTALWDQAPVREALDGMEIKLPGFVVPVEADENETTGFLLVPYYGACVHVPPPPANQTVYVLTEVGKGARPELFDVIWVSGTMSVKRIDNDIAEAGYTLYASAIEPYE